MEARLFDPAQPPEWVTPEWYAGREAAPHLEQEGHRDRLLLTSRIACELLGAFRYSSKPANVVDLGAGDGGLLFQIRADAPCFVAPWGYDLQATNVAAARLRSIDVEWRDVVRCWPREINDWEPDLILATEFLEHLVDPHEMLRRIHKTRAPWLIVSSPYTETADSHYEFHTWAWDLEGYRSMLEDNGWRVLRQETAWISQVLLAERRP